MKSPRGLQDARRSLYGSTFSGGRTSPLANGAQVTGSSSLSSALGGDAKSLLGRLLKDDSAGLLLNDEKSPRVPPPKMPDSYRGSYGDLKNSAGDSLLKDDAFSGKAYTSRETRSTRDLYRESPRDASVEKRPGGRPDLRSSPDRMSYSDIGGSVSRQPLGRDTRTLKSESRYTLGSRQMSGQSLISESDGDPRPSTLPARTLQSGQTNQRRRRRKNVSANLSGTRYEVGK